MVEIRVFKYPLQVRGGLQELTVPLDAVVLKLGINPGGEVLVCQCRRARSFLRTGA